MLRFPLLAAALALLSAPPAHAAFHAALIDEVHATPEDGEGFVEIRMLGAGQNFVGHSRLSAWNCNGSFKGIVLEVPGNVTNSGSNVRWIMATSTAATSGVTPDFTFAVGALPLGCGMVCWGAPVPPFVPENPPTWDETVSSNYVDCVAYGGYTGTNVPPVAGTPTSLTASNNTTSLTRIGSSANNANDFALACPTPTNNAGTTGNPVCTTTTSLAPTTSTTETTTTVTTTITGTVTVTTTTETSTTVAGTTSTLTTTTTSSSYTSSTSTTSSITTTSSSSSTSTTSSTTTTSSSSSTSSTSTTSTSVPPPLVNLLSGKLLLLKGKTGKPARSALAMTSDDPALGLGSGNGSEHDPTLHDGSLRLVSSASGAFDQTYTLAGGWKYVGKAGQNKGYKWKSKAGPITSIVLRKGKVLQVAGHGAGLGIPLASDPKPVDVVLSLGNLHVCFEFGGTTKFVAGKSFKATKAAAPSACP